MAQRGFLEMRHFGGWQGYAYGIGMSCAFGFLAYRHFIQSPDAAQLAIEANPRGFLIRPPVYRFRATDAAYGSYLAYACAWLPFRVLQASNGFGMAHDAVDELRGPIETITDKRAAKVSNKIGDRMKAATPVMVPLVCEHFALLDLTVDLNELVVFLCQERGFVVDKMRQRFPAGVPGTVAPRATTETDPRDHPDNWKPLSFFSKEGNKRELVRQAAKPDRKSKRVERKFGVDGKTYLYCVSDARQWGYYP